MLVNALKTLQQNATSDNFYRNIGTVAVLGSSITFALIVTDIKDPKEVSRHGKFDLSAVRILLAVSWLLFMFSLNLSFSFAQFMPHKHHAAQLLASKIAYIVTIAAVLFLALVVSAYVEVVGYIGIGLASYVAIVVVAGAIGGR